MKFTRRLVPSPAGLVGLGSVVILAIHTAWLVLFCWQRSTFANDDILSFWRARTQPFATYLLRPIDDHFVPLHRLICYLLLKAAPMNFEVGVALLAVLHVATLVVLWRILEKIRSSPLNAVLVCVYGLQACLGPQFLWFTAGLGRLGCVFFSSVAMLCYLRFRGNQSRRALLLTVLSTAGALGFYAKGLLVPVHLAALEIALFAGAGSAERRASMAALAALAPVIGLYLLAWRAMTRTAFYMMNLDPVFHARFLAASLPIFAESCLGVWLDDGRALTLVALATWSGAILYTANGSRRALAAWALLFSCVALHMSMVGLSALRTTVFGLTLTRLDRYYFDAALLVPVFAAIAVLLGGLDAREHPLVTAVPSRWALAFAALGSLAFMASTSAASLRRIQATDGDYLGVNRDSKLYGRAAAGSYYPMHQRARAFMSNLRADLALVPPPRRRPLRIVDSPLPWYVMPWGELSTHSAELLTLMAEDVRVGRDGDYFVSPEGHLRDGGRWRAAESTNAAP
jgi:hypothetical protein